MATIKDLAEQYGLEDYQQLLGGYPNAEKFITGLKDAAVRSVPTTEQMRDPNFIIDTAGLGGAIKALKLHHGSDRIVPKVERQGLFDAIFATPDRDAALSHGDKISNYYVNESKIGHDFGDKYDDAMTLLRHHYPNASDDDIENILYPAIAEDVTPWNMNHEEVMRVTGVPDMSEASWKLQADRGKIGKALGYDAVKVRDEHGDSYMIPFGSKAKYRAGSLDELANKYNEMHPDKNYVSWDVTSDPYLNAEGDEVLGNPYALIEKVYTHPDDRNKGVATRLMSDAMREIESKHPNMPIKLSPIPLDKDTDTERLMNFYRKFGFDEMPEGHMQKYAEGGAVDSAISDYKQLLSGYPNATKFANALQSNIESHIPTTEDLQSPERMGEWSLAAALNQPTGLTFIGKNARNWDAQAAKLAEEKLNAGANPAEVWREHLIGRMPDKTLFSEISDYPASFKGVGSFGDVVMNRLDALQNAGKKTIDDPMNVADIFTHRDLAESYPELFPSTEVRFLSKDDKSKGSMQVMDDGTNILKMPYDATRDKTSTMLHELQHAIQSNEGWTRGGSPGQFVPELIDMQDAAYEKIKSLNSDMAFISKQLDKVKESKFDMRPELYEKKLNNLKNKYDELMNERDSHVANAQLDIPSEAFKRYKNLAGEAQARATQDRLDMDMAQRRENYPLAGGKLSDIPLEELIYKYEGNGPSLSADPLSKYKDYVGEHSAPLGDSGAPLHNLTANENAIYPSDVYSSQANQYYGSGEPEDAQLFAMAQRLKDKPNEKVTIYRAVPKVQSNSEKAAQLEKDLANYMKRGRMPSNSDFNNKSDWYEWASNERDRLASLPEETLDPLSINHGDWVALDKKYAKEHGESALGGNYKILSKKVPARQLFTNGDSIREWGWDSRYAQGGSVDKDSLQLNKPRRTPNHPTKSHIVKTMVDGKEKIIRFGEQGAETAGKPKEGESDRMTAKRESFKARHAKNIAKGPSSAAYWANKVKWAEGGSVSMEDLPFNDPDQLRLYHQAMQHFDDLMENTGGSKKMGKTEARINYNTTTKGDRDRDKDLHTLIADYGVDVGKDARINATMIKPMEAEGVYLGNLSGSVPVGEGRASLGLQGLHTKYSDGLSGYTAGYNGKVGGGDLSASYFEPADHNSAGRQVQLEYSMPFADGGSVDTTFGLSLNHGLSGIASTANTSNDQPVVNTISPNQVTDATPKYKSPYYHAEFNPTGNLVYTTRPGTNPGMPDAIDRYQRDKDGNWHDYGTEGLVMYGDTPMTSRQNVELNLKNAQQKADDMLATQRAMVVVNAMPFNPFNQSWNDTMADPLKDPNNPAYQARQNVLDWQKHLDTFEPYKPFTPPQAYSHGGTVGYADGGSVSEFEDPAHERLYRRAMAHFDDMSAKQNFEDNDSMIASTILHPVEAAKRAGNAFMRSVDTAGGRPKQALDESSWYPVGIAPSMDEQAQAGLDLAGLMQTGAMPFAPESAGGTLGTLHKFRIGDLGYDLRFDDRKLEQDKLQNMVLQLSRPENEKRIISLANYEGYPWVTSMSDRTNVGNLHYINDRPVDVDLQGGQDYMFNNPGQVWASAQAPVNAIMKYGKELSERAGGLDPLYMPWRMAPTGGDYANMTGETMLKYMRSNMNKKEQRAVNKGIKDFIPDFKGIESEEGIDQFRNAPDKVRKALKNHLDTKYRNAGGISIGEARLAVADPSQLLALDTGLQNVGQIYIGNPIIQESGHRAYPRGVPGQGLGVLDRDVMAYDLMPEVAEYRGLIDLKNPRTTDIRAIQMKPYGGIITDKILKNLGYAKGGSVGLQELANKYM